MTRTILLQVPLIIFLLFFFWKGWFSGITGSGQEKEQEELLYSMEFLQIPRSLVSELEGPLQELETLFVPIPGLTLYGEDAFKPRTDDRTLQYISNASFIQGWAKELYFYEHEFRRNLNREGLTARSRARTIRSNWVGPKGERGQKLFQTLKGTRRFRKKNWKQNSGTLVHRFISVLAQKYKLSHGEYVRDIKGLFYYPPGGFREWHTNMLDDTSWRLYYIHTTEDDKSWFRYVPAGSNKTVLVPDRTGYYNMFRLRGRKNELLWHSVYSDTNRFSVGFKITPSFAAQIIGRFREAESGSSKPKGEKTTS